LLVMTCLPTVFAAQPVRSHAAAKDAAVRVLQDREAIRVLLRDYGRTLDARDFEGFAALFATDAEYVSGATVRGPAAIGQSLYVVTGERNTPELALMASYDDVLVREDGRWKFQKRVVRGNIPAPRPRT